MATLTSAGITFGDATTQSTAAVSASTAFDGVGSYATAYYAQNAVTTTVNRSQYIARGATIAGSSLRVNSRATSSNVTTVVEAGSGGMMSGVQNAVNVSAFPTSNTTTLSGTWRVMSGGVWQFTADAGSPDYVMVWPAVILVRIS